MIPVLITLASLFFAGIWWLEIRTKQFWARQLSTLAAHHCPKCGQVFGQSVAVAAREAHRAQCDKARLQHPNCKINFSRVWPVRCPACSFTTEFDSETLQLKTRNA